jgi:hypothetical protein
LAQAGFGFRDSAQGKLSATYVIRSEGDRGQLFVVDADRILAREAAPFELAAGDVIYVPPTAITSWNEALTQILPRCRPSRACSPPFVQDQVSIRNEDRWQMYPSERPGDQRTLEPARSEGEPSAPTALVAPAPSDRMDIAQLRELLGQNLRWIFRRGGQRVRAGRPLSRWSRTRSFRLAVGSIWVKSAAASSARRSPSEIDLFRRRAKPT